MDRNIAYYKRRLVEERRAGMAAASEKVRDCHFTLAAAYETRLNELAKKAQPKLRIVTA